MGGLGPKLLLPVGGRTLLERAAGTFLGHPSVGEIVAAVPVRLAADARRALGALPNPRAVRVAVVPGGPTRQRSVAIAIAALTKELPMIAVHDVARALVRGDLVTRVLDAVRRDGGAIPVLPIRDTI